VPKLGQVVTFMRLFNLLGRKAGEKLEKKLEKAEEKVSGKMRRDEQSKLTRLARISQNYFEIIY